MPIFFLPMLLHACKILGVMVPNYNSQLWSFSFVLLDSVKIDSFFSRGSSMPFKKSYYSEDIALMISPLRVIVKFEQISLNNLSFEACSMMRSAKSQYASENMKIFNFQINLLICLPCFV